MSDISWIQEYLAKYRMTFPIYEDGGCSGPVHNALYTIKVSLPGFGDQYTATGEGGKKKEAKAKAARSLRQKMEESPPHRATSSITDDTDHESLSNNTANRVAVASSYTVNFVGIMQDYVQQRGLELPEYEDTGFSGPDHQREFSCEVRLPGRGHQFVFSGTGMSKKEAKVQAAEQLYSRLMEERDASDRRQALEQARHTTWLATRTSAGNVDYEDEDEDEDEAPSGTELKGRYVTMVQEMAQKQFFPMPEYQSTGCDGPSHRPMFTCEVSLPGEGEDYTFVERGLTKKDAKWRAAKRLHAKLLESPLSDDIGKRPYDGTVAVVSGNSRLNQSLNPNGNYVGFLNQYSQKGRLPFPVYEQGEPSGPDHQKRYTCHASLSHLGAWCSATGEGRCKKDAKAQAAKALYETMMDHVTTPRIGRRLSASSVQHHHQPRGCPVYGEDLAVGDNLRELMDSCQVGDD